MKKEKSFKIPIIIAICIIISILLFFKLDKMIEEKRNEPIQTEKEIIKDNEEEITNNPLFGWVILSGIFTGEIICACVCLI